MKKILLVEDAVDLAKVVCQELTDAGYDVTHVADGITAMAQIESHLPDLIVLDWMLPKMDGLEVLRRLRQQSIAVPVIMLTARNEEIDRVIGLEIGADDYLAKPFSLRELVARVRAVLRRIEHVQQILNEDRNSANTTLSYGPLVLDPDAYQAYLDCTPLDLTRTEFALLHLLLRNPGRAFSRSYLLEAVWDQHYVVGDRSVDNVMLRLRKKLKGLSDIIETVWGIGYRLTPE